METRFPIQAHHEHAGLQLIRCRRRFAHHETDLAAFRRERESGPAVLIRLSPRLYPLPVSQSVGGHESRPRFLIGAPVNRKVQIAPFRTRKSLLMTG